jgi:lipopolysaccharide export system permease protein
VKARTIERYLATQIYTAASFVLAGFLALFAFFDLVNELADLGTGDYHLREILIYVALTVPAHAYELFPVVVLIGTLYVLAYLASNSEYTVMRAAGFSPRDAGAILVKIGLAFVAITFVLGEWVAPIAEQAAQTLKMRAKSSLIGQELKSGLWFKDERSFINVREARRNNLLSGVRIYEFGTDYKLNVARAAERGEYLGGGVWRLSGVAQTRLTPEGPRVEKLAQFDWRTALTPELLNVLIVAPERMSAWRLYKYTEHLAGNRQKTERYEIAMWKKLVYPIATLVMMALALPFAYMHVRAGLVGVKVFFGIMLGIAFHMLNSLFSHIGLLQNWPPFTSAVLPSVAFLTAAVIMMWWVERR